MPQNLLESKRSRKEAADKLLFRRRARSNLLDFTRFTFPEYRSNWHHELICKKLDEFVDGKNKRLIIAAPPRHGKTEIVSKRFPAYLLGRNPDAKIIACSYASDLASLINRDIQRIIISPEYKELFPDTTLNISNVRSKSQESYLRNSDIFEIVGHKGVYRSAGVGGSITGLGGNVLIVDDPFRSRADVESPTIRNKVYEWYSSTFRTRRQKGASILLIATRWHEADLTGKLLELSENDPAADQWEVINLPALSEEPLADYDQRTGPNQALWPVEFPESDLLGTKASCAVYEWLSLYQQRPSAAAGNLFKHESFKYAKLSGSIIDLGDKKVLLEHCKIFQTCDPAASTKTTADYFVLATWAQTPQNDLVLLDVLRTRLEGPDQVNIFKQQYLRWKPAFQAVEAAGIGKTLYQMLVREGLPVTELKADTDKVTRALPAAARMEAGTIYFAQGDWLHDVETELLGFPNAAHDDIVDCVSYAVLIVIGNRLNYDAYESNYVGTSFSSGSMRI